MKIYRPTLGLLLSMSLLACQQQADPAAQGSAHDDDARNAAEQAEPAEARTDDAGERLAQLFEEYFEASLQRNPIQATFIGDSRYNDRLPDFLSAEYRRETHEFNVEWLNKVRAIERGTLSDQDKISYDLFVYQQRQALEGEQFPDWMQPANQFFSMHNFFAQLGSGAGAQPFKTVEDYDNWLSRVEGMVALNQTAIDNMRQGMEAGVVQPKAVMRRVLPQLEAHIVEDIEQSVFYGPVRNLPEDFPEAEKQRLTAAYTEAINTRIIPIYRDMHDFIESEYLPACRDTVGMRDLPDGENWYNYRIKVMTTTDRTADEIHQFGLDEVARIRGEMERVMQEVRFDGNLQEFFAWLKSNDEFYYQDKEALLQGYRDLQDKVNERLPELFDIAPKADYEVRAVEAFREQSQAGASYQPATPDGSRPGIFYVNTYNLRAQPKYGMETLSLHEASPGHHFQISIQQEIEDMPKFRRFGGYTAFSEGWALYAESIGKEMGMFEDPYQYFGRLSDEMLRAMRLVVDTGLHAKGWTRQQAIDYMLDNSDMAESDVIAEVERYIVVAGQALAYKIGQSVISELRAKAEQELGDAFDIKAFHRLVLTGGSMPMAVLRQRVNAWIEDEAESGGSPIIPTLREVGSRGFFVLDGPFAEFDPTHPSVEIWTPDDDANAPVMVYAHGGAGYREDDRARVAMFRRNGFATVSFDSYVMNGFDDWNFVTRSVANSGKQNMIWGVFKGAVDHAAANDDWDNRNIFLYGGSNGGRVVLYAGSKIENENIRGIIAEAPAGSGFALDDYTVPTIIPFGALDTWAGKSDTDYIWKRTYPNSPISIEDWVNAQQTKGRPVNFIFYENAGHLLFEGPLELVTVRRGDAIAFTAYRGAAEGVLEQYEKDVMSFATGKLVQKEMSQSD